VAAIRHGGRERRAWLRQKAGGEDAALKAAALHLNLGKNGPPERWPLSATADANGAHGCGKKQAAKMLRLRPQRYI